MKAMKKRRQWNSEEKTLLLKLFPKYTSKKWKKISQQFRKKGFRRKQVEIRDRWINFYDPCVNKSEWKPEQLKLIYDSYDVHGTKWCKMQNIVGRQVKYYERTQNMIKNRFYGTMRNYVRFILKNSRLHTIQCLRKISKLSPKILGDIYSSQSKYQFMNDEPRKAIISMNFLLNQTILSDRMTILKKIYDKLAVLLIEQINQIAAFQDQQDSSTQKQEVKIQAVVVKEAWSQSQSQYEVSSSQQQQQQQQSSMINKGVKVEEKANIEETVTKKQENDEEMMHGDDYYPFLDPKEYKNGLYSYQLFSPFQNFPYM